MNDLERVQRILQLYENGDYAPAHEFPDIYRVTSLSWNEWCEIERAKAFLTKVYIPCRMYDELVKKGDPFLIEGLSYRQLLQNPVSCFPSRFCVRKYPGGILFDRGTYESLREALNRIGEDTLFICGGFEMERDLVRFSIPISLSWDDIIRGGYAVYNVFKDGYGFFRVFGNNKNWCLLSMNENVLTDGRYDHSIAAYFGVSGKSAQEVHSLYGKRRKEYEKSQAPPFTEELLSFL